jgi:hypothetical protein
MSGGYRPIELGAGQLIGAYLQPIAAPVALSGDALRRLEAALLKSDVIPEIDKYERMGVGLSPVWAGEDCSSASMISEF